MLFHSHKPHLTCSYDQAYNEVHNARRLVLQWFEENWITQNRILDLGTGTLHNLGKLAASHRIFCWGITLSVHDVNSYRNLYLNNPSIMKYYTLSFMNWYYFQPAAFPKFDTIFAEDLAICPDDIGYEEVEFMVDLLSKSTDRLCLDTEGLSLGPSRWTIKAIVEKYRHIAEFYDRLVFLNFRTNTPE